MEPSTDPHLNETRAYYDAFSGRYEAHRDGRDPGGYHDLVDELETSFVERFGRGRDVLEVGCGTGLLLERIRTFAKSTKGVDLSPGMLKLARDRGFDAVEGSATALPFADASFDVACSFKVLAHVREVDRALAEMARVVRPGGYVIAEFYNPFSFRGLAKKVGPAGAVSEDRDESAVFTRFDTPKRGRELAPEGTRLIASRGVRIVTPAAALMRVPFLGNALRDAERRLCDTWMSSLAGFWIGAYWKEI